MRWGRKGDRGVSVTASELPEHAAEGIRILEETALGPGRVRIKAVIGTDLPQVIDYVLVSDGDEWRIASQQTDAVTERRLMAESSPPAAEGWLGSLFGRRKKAR